MTRIAVFSDIHAFAPRPDGVGLQDGDPSWARTIPDQLEEDRGPFQALARTIENEALQADLLLCCGDMGDKADLDGVRFTWGWLETLRRRLRAELVIGTTGNHDVDSRNQSGRGDPMHCVRALQPPFPMDVPAPHSDYWERNVALVETGDTAVLVVNTAAEHSSPELAKRGRLTQQTLDTVRDTIADIKGSERIALVHHHPYRHDAIDWKDNSELEGGPELLRLLEDNGDWLVIHGHRHYPNIVYAAGGTRAPVILAAGSFAAILYPELGARVRNQFHIVDVQPPGSIAGTAGMIGSIRSWEYSPANGWARPISQEGIPDGAGFGYRGSVADVADTIERFVSASDDSFVTLGDVIVTNPSLRYVLPRDRGHVLEQLASRGVLVSPTANSYSVLADEVFLKGVVA
jgi:3',5'-cyclic AMP phosphodiesterase CpdA